MSSWTGMRAVPPPLQPRRWDRADEDLKAFAFYIASRSFPAVGRDLVAIRSTRTGKHTAAYAGA